MLRSTTLVLILVFVATCSNAQERPRKDFHGDALPKGAVARLGTLRWRIGECPLLFTSDGRRAVGVGYRPFLVDSARSEERRVGKECRSRWSPYH